MSKTSNKQRIDCFLKALPSFTKQFNKRYRVYRENGKQWNGNGIIYTIKTN